MTSHDASASAIGYLYQTDWALLELLRGARTRADQAMTIELFDDVAWDQDGDIQELLQLKHHQRSSGDLSDKSVDLWKTLKVWLDTPAFVDDEGPLLTLVTTSGSGSGTAASYLGSDSERDPGRALDLLNAAAIESTAQITEVARKKWLSTPASARLSMTQRMRVIGAAVRIEDVEKEVRTEIVWAIPSGQEEAFLALVWRWWRMVVLDLLRKKRDRVNVMEAKEQVQNIRDLFLPDNLPTLVQLSQVDEQLLVETHSSHLFVHQLRWINVGLPHLRRAIVDYHRAVTQTTQWMDQSLIGLKALEDFDNNLVDEWDSAFQDMMEDLDLGADEAARQEVGKLLWRKLRESTKVTVRPRYTDPFFARGKRHELADSHRIGWHPDFEARIEALIAERPTGDDDATQ